MDLFDGITLVDALRLSLLPLATALILLFLVGTAKNDNSIIDVAWGPLFVLLLAVQFTDRWPSGAGLAVFALVAVWALRLAWAIAAKQSAHDGEDPRYARWRKQWKHVRLRGFFQVYVLQGLLVLLVGLPLLVAVRDTGPVEPLATVGAAVWALGLLVESTADRQFREFARKPSNRGQLLTTGLRRFSRHPQYFGEFLIWVGIAIAAYPAVGAFAFLSPLVALYLVRFLSGVPIADKRLRKKPGYAAYARRTNAFVPFPPKSSRPS